VLVALASVAQATVAPVTAALGWAAASRTGMEG
jgi:hypothetical protein